MKQLILCAWISFGILTASYTQSAKTVSYGNNPRSGRFYKIRGIKIYCEVYGTGAPLLMIHGNGGSIRNFEKNIGYFAKKNYRVIVPDSRAHGKSRDEGDSLSFDMMADDMNVLLDSLHIKSCELIGWSDGAITGLLLAIRHPQKISKMAVTGANLWTDSTTLVSSAWRKDNLTYSLLKSKLISSFTEKNTRKLFMLDWLQRKIAPGDLQDVRCPTLVIAGDRDVISLGHTSLIYQHIPHAYLWIVPDSGHRTFFEHDALFNDTVDAFFKNSYRKR